MKIKSEPTITIFHLYRNDGTALFLHPFDDAEVLRALDEQTQIFGKYGQEPQVEYITLFRKELYRAVDTAVNSWIQEKKFIPNFLWASGGFLMLYFLFTFTLRDPLPMIDELIVAGAGAVGVYLYRLRKAHTLPQAEQLRKKLRRRMDRIEFHEDSFVKEVEDQLHRYESVSRETLLKSMSMQDEISLSDAEVKDANMLIAYLEKRFSSTLYRKQEKMMDRYVSSGGVNRRFDVVRKLAERGKIDLSLFVTYRSLKRRAHVR
jgi:hypothetical protein